MTDAPVKVGIIGCGTIFPVYVAGLASMANRAKIVACSDVVPERAEVGAALAGAARWGTNDDLLADPEVSVVINLTPPAEHAAVIRSALQSGKHVFTEKPLTIDVADAADLVELAQQRGLILGAAADTFLGSAGQTARSVIDAGTLGDVFGFSLFSSYSRAETWHPDPGFLFRAGGGPLLDAGPYFIAALVNLLGPVRQVSGRTMSGPERRTVSAPHRLVHSVAVEVPTHAVAILETVGGAVGTLVATFDVWNENQPPIEIYGHSGVMHVAHPNWFGGDVTVQLHHDSHPALLDPVVPSVPGEGRGGTMLRGLGVMDLIDATAGHPHRTSGALGLHVLEVLQAVQTSSDRGNPVAITSTVEPPTPLTPAQLASWYTAPEIAGLGST